MAMMSSYRTAVILAVTLVSCARVPVAEREVAAPASSGSGSLVIEIGGLRNATGRLNVSLFDGPEGFPQDTLMVVRSESVQLMRDQALVVRFADVKYGEYAVAVLHDENSNSEMDTGFLGMPTEGFGFSNNPGLGFGAPSFETCKFRFDGPEVILQIRIWYF